MTPPPNTSHPRQPPNRPKCQRPGCFALSEPANLSIPEMTDKRSPSDRLPAANPVNQAHRGVLIAAAGQDEFDRLNPDREISVLDGTLVAAVSVN